jgi:spore coat protein H
LPADGEPSADYFRAHPVCRIQIELEPQHFAQLRNDSRAYVPATIRSLGEVFRRVGVHLKGSSGSFRDVDDKPSFTLDFERFVPGQRFHGLQKIHLNNSVEDPSYLKEQLGSELFRRAGIPAPRVAHALVELNGRRLGFFVLKEGFTKDFLGRHFSSADGNLYDTDLGHDVNLPMKRHLGNDSADDQSDLQRLASAALEPNVSRRWERLNETLAVDRFLTFMVMEIMVCHWDGYCLGRNNFRIYHDPEMDKIVFLPSGMDQLFAKADLPWKPGMAGLVARAVMETPEGREQYATRFRSLFQTRFASGELAERVNELLANVRPFLKRREFETMRREAADLCVQIKQRELDLRKQLSEPEPAFPEFHDGIASLSRWTKVNETAEGTMSEVASADGGVALRIAGISGTSSSWRSTIRLNPGRYRFQGKAKTIGVVPLPFGKNHGASLRVAGTDRRSSNLVGTAGWEMLGAGFDVTAPGTEIGLVCELRASAGEVLFDRSSLVLIRLTEK